MKKIITILALFVSAIAVAVTNGNAVLKFTTKTYNGSYSPKHCLAAWITDNNNYYVKSLEVKAHFPAYGTYLTKWKNSSGHNTNQSFSEIDAITGASQTSHTSHTLNWDLKDYSGNLVPDGRYKVNLEFTEINGTGKYYNFSFDKEPNSSTITPADQSYFKSMNLTYTALTSIDEQEKSSNLKLSSYPNPFNNTSAIVFDVKNTAVVSLEIYDTKGDLVKTLIKGQLESGHHSALWEGTNNTGSNVASGTYIYILKCGDQAEIKKTLLLK